MSSITHAAAVIELAQTFEGNLGVDVAEAHDVWWDVTAWEDRANIEKFMNTEPHLSTIKLVDHLCSEASFVDWEQDSADLPDWQTSWRRLVADGRSAINALHRGGDHRPVRAPSRSCR